jgi:hypothetical protein
MRTNNTKPGRDQGTEDLVEKVFVKNTTRQRSIKAKFRKTTNRNK